MTSFCRYCNARAEGSFGAKKIRTTVQLQISEKIRILVRKPSFFSQSHHDPQGSRLKLFPGLAFGGPPTFFARENFNRYHIEVENHSLFKFLCFQRFHKIFPKLSSDPRRNFGKLCFNINEVHIRIQMWRFLKYFDQIVNTLRCKLHIMIDFRKNLEKDSERSLRRE